MMFDLFARGGGRAAIALWAWMSATAGQLEGAVTTPEQLMERIASAAGSSVRYREEKRLSFLDYPLVSYGTLRFEAPDRLIRETDGPDGTRYLASGSTLVIEETGKDPREIRLDDHPSLRTLMDTMRVVFAGNLLVLNRLCRVTLEVHGNDWALNLEPRDDEISRFVSKIRVSGRDERIRTIETLETGGDRVLMTIFPEG